ncbi:hypothetical protein D7030_03080 [Flavobacteriaceae bacterium AU392]|nr:hypothetical protein D1817_09555 [Flavobacteriaceae bacterium]RKM85669.1 hypothetical protein D7030_03080 [Flavobacteriaceae bacterium AU392]
MKNILIILVIITLTGCKKEVKKDSIPSNEIETVVESKINSHTDLIEIAHKKAIFDISKAIKFDIDLTFGGQQILDATISVSTNSEYSIIEMKNGEKIYIHNDKVFCSPGLKDDPSVRFGAYTWSYFFLFPYKLNDNGTKWSSYTPSESENQFNASKLTFEANIGDAPDDWYVVYSDKNTNIIDHAAYIVTLGKTTEEAEKDPHAIQYLDYKPINDIPFAHNWIFWEWRTEEGLTNKIGSATLSNIQFIDDLKANFKIPDGYIEK